MESLFTAYKSEDFDWLIKLCKGSLVWLVKEKKYVVIHSVYESISYDCGRIVFSHFDDKSKIETWMVRPDGRGIDFSQLFLPVKSNLSENLLTYHNVDLMIPSCSKTPARHTAILDGYFPAYENRCRHTKCPVYFVAELARSMEPVEVRRKYPRFVGICPDCRLNVIVYASQEHYVLGDW